MSLSLPAELSEWLDDKAAALDLAEEELVVQALAAYRAADELDDDLDPAEFLGVDDPAAVEDAVREVVADRLPDIADAVSDRIEGGETEAVEEGLHAELDRVESDVDEKIEDVRQRVVQVKREADAKAPADHDHGEFDALAGRLDDLAGELDEIESAVADLRTETDAHAEELAEVADRLDDLADVEERLDTAEQRLRTVAWVANDLREAHESRSGATRAIDRLKRAAAEADVARAVCEECGDAVELALLTEPNCPHCGTAVSDVRPASGLFGKPTLVAARQLDAGDDAPADVPEAARRNDSAASARKEPETANRQEETADGGATDTEGGESDDPLADAGDSE